LAFTNGLGASGHTAPSRKAPLVPVNAAPKTGAVVVKPTISRRPAGKVAAAYMCPSPVIQTASGMKPPPWSGAEVTAPVDGSIRTTLGVGLPATL